LPVYRDIEPGRGGFKGPVPVSEFILNHLAHGDDYIANMHRLYIQELLDAAIDAGRVVFNLRGEVNRARSRLYHQTTYHSFEMAVQRLARSGQIHFSGREEASDDPRFINWNPKPDRRYYTLGGAK
jgi:hypothetical protein